MIAGCPCAVPLKAAVIGVSLGRWRKGCLKMI